MPTYCYEDSDGVILERVFSMGEAPFKLRENGQEFTRSYRAERKGVPSDSAWPMEPCFGSGVNAEDAQKLRDHFKKHNVPTQVTNDGDPIYESAAHRKRALKCRNLFDKGSYY
jgi:hypothetical protein